LSCRKPAGVGDDLDMNVVRSDTVRGGAILDRTSSEPSIRNRSMPVADRSLPELVKAAKTFGSRRGFSRSRQLNRLYCRQICHHGAAQTGYDLVLRSRACWKMRSAGRTLTRHSHLPLRLRYRHWRPV
jgi:hypothetical protein